ncbi:hypothetical protein FDECE_215 [Fusarium decemcellulare]|nr:hypothetical protein FDECE_215 [Fusarium decemcellulare]
MTSLVLHPKSVGLQAKSSTHRSPLACLNCRSRKVRCDVSKKSQPCTNCILDKHDCIVTKRGARRPNPLYKPLVRNRGAKENRQTQSPCESIRVQVQDEKSTEKQPSTIQDFTGAGSEGFNNIPTQDVRTDTDSSTNASPGSSDNVPLAAELFSCVGSSPVNEPLSEPTNLIIYCSYSFMSVSNMFYAPQQDVQLLDSKGCFKLPIRSILDCFIEQYFLHVHPLLPVLSESDFWEAYNSPLPPETQRTSLFLIQAMLFASSNFVPIEILRQLGYNSVRGARAAFYSKAKLLYDVRIDASPIQTAQASLLLTYWTPSLRAESKPNTSWLRVAIETAKTLKADLYSKESSLYPEETNKHADLRRLWWCCIIRDRILHLDVRRSILITPAHFDFEKNFALGSAELQKEVRCSRMYCSETRESLATIIAETAKLCVILTDLLLMVFPSNGGRGHWNSDFSVSCRLRTNKDLLRRWYNENPFGDWGILSEDKSVILYTSLMYTYYHWATIVLCYFDMRNSQAFSKKNSPQMTVTETQCEVRRSVSNIADILERLDRLELAQWLPISIVAYTAFPLALHILDAMFAGHDESQTTERKNWEPAKQRRLSSMINVMKLFHEHYDGVEEVVGAIRHFIRHVEQHTSSNTVVSGGYGNSSISSGWDLNLSLAMDWTLSSGKSPESQDFASYLRMLVQTPINERRGTSFATKASSRLSTVPDKTSDGPGLEKTNSYNEDANGRSDQSHPNAGLLAQEGPGLGPFNHGQSPATRDPSFTLDPTLSLTPQSLIQDRTEESLVFSCIGEMPNCFVDFEGSRNLEAEMSLLVDATLNGSLVDFGLSDVIDETGRDSEAQ